MWVGKVRKDELSMFDRERSATFNKTIEYIQNGLILYCVSLMQSPNSSKQVVNAKIKVNQKPPFRISITPSHTS